MLCDGLEEWGGVWGEAHGEGIYVCMQLVCFIVQQKPTQPWKAVIL